MGTDLSPSWLLQLHRLVVSAKKKLKQKKKSQRILGMPFSAIPPIFCGYPLHFTIAFFLLYFTTLNLKWIAHYLHPVLPQKSVQPIRRHYRKKSPLCEIAPLQYLLSK